MRLVHATDKTWYKVLYHHTTGMYVISLSNISIKTNFKQITRVELKCVDSEGDYILCMTSCYFFRSFTNVRLLVLSHIPMVWRHVKVVRQRTSRATSRHSFITTVWWYILYQTPCIRQATFVNFKGKRIIVVMVHFSSICAQNPLFDAHSRGHLISNVPTPHFEHVIIPSTPAPKKGYFKEI